VSQVPPPPLGPAGRPDRRTARRTLWLAVPLALAGLLVAAVLVLARSVPPDPAASRSPEGVAAPAGPTANVRTAAEPPAGAETDAEPTPGGPTEPGDPEAEPDDAPASRDPARPTPPGEVWQVRVADRDGANMRREPSGASQRVKVVRNGTPLELIGPDRQAEGQTWRNVRDETGASGWVLSELLVEERDAGPRPTPTPAPIQIVVTDLTSPVGRGEDATLTITTQPETRCEVKVLLFGPTSLPREGLEPKVSDADGKCSWTWTVPPEAVSGTWRYSITVGTGATRANREVTFGIS
jgi:hypothetical protein